MVATMAALLVVLLAASKAGLLAGRWVAWMGVQWAENLAAEKAAW